MYSAWDILAHELGVSPEKFQGLLVNHYEFTLKNLKGSALYRKGIPLILARDLRPRGQSAPLLTRGQNIWENLESLAQRLRKSSRGVGHPMIEATLEVNEHFHGEVVEKIQSIRDKLLKRMEDVAEGDMEKSELRREFQEISSCLNEIIDKYIASPEVMASLLSPSSIQEAENLLEENVVTALLSMRVTKHHKRYRTLGEVRGKMVEVGTAALLQDLSLFMEPGAYPEDDETQHARKSAALCLTLGCENPVVNAVANHHRTVDRIGCPINNSGIEFPDLNEKIIVAVNHFSRCMSRFKMNTTETIYMLSVL
ncbi:MAG: hypothetical protein ACOC0U_07585, partial [Desulfovibrionales bacterium]